MGFEQRIQERRYAALLETMKAAIAASDALGAHAALSEARELRPSAPELDAYELRVRSIPAVTVSTAALNVSQWRAVGAVALLLVGISLVTGLDYLRSLPPPDPQPDTLAVPMQIPATDVRMEAEAPVTVPAISLRSEAAPIAAERPRGTSGRDIVTSRLEVAERTDTITIPESLRPRARDEVGIPPREVPDDFVYPTLEAAPSAASPATTDMLPPRSSGIVPMTPLAAATAAARRGTTAIPAPPPSTLAPVVAPAAAARLEETRVNDVLNAYARAYGRLDASAARAVWPTVNERALARAFASLESQNVSFENCDIELHGVTANASCRGQASYVGKVGSREPRVEPREWRFELRREGEAWKIENAEARRQ